MRLLYIIVFTLLLTSCMSVEKAASYLQSKGKLAEVCAESFPIKERIIEGSTIVQTDTITVEGAAVVCPVSEVPTVVKCPPVKVEVRHSFRVDTLYQENTAKVDMYKTKYLEEKILKEAVQKELTSMTESRDEWRSRCIGLFVCFVAVVGVVVFFKYFLVR